MLTGPQKRNQGLGADNAKDLKKNLRRLAWSWKHEASHHIRGYYFVRQRGKPRVRFDHSRREEE